jgi:hypothetical protein
MKPTSQEEILLSLVQDDTGVEWAIKRMGWNLNGFDTGTYKT